MTPELPVAIRTMMAERPRRMHHYLWHQVRNSWLRFPPETQHTLWALGWEPPRPGRAANGSLLLDNGSGEDFLYMYRQMIAAVDAKLAEIGDSAYPRVQGWPSMPWPDDLDYPVPDAWDTGDAGFTAFLARVKSDAFFRATLAAWETYYREPSTLRRLTLSQLGSLIEYTVHNFMHMRWAADPIGSRPDPGPDDCHMISTEWDSVDYDYLGDTYSSHVNALFWKLHGWVDNRIEDWRRANRLEGIAWTGTWLGATPRTPEDNAEHSTLAIQDDHMARMEAAAKIISECQVFHRLYADALQTEHGNGALSLVGEGGAHGRSAACRPLL